jgi:hypothetical protein
VTKPVDPALLPSIRELQIATGAAVLVAALLAVTTVLPAEWGIDPTGAGSVLGLTAMGELKQAAHEDAPAETAPEPEVYPHRTDELSLTLSPNEGREIKAVMRKGDSVDYEWTASQGELFFDFHGEPKGAAADVFTSFEKGTKPSAKGVFEAPFEGVHGWYWKNRTEEPITVSLKTDGVYKSIAILH